MKNLPLRLIRYIVGLFVLTIGVGFAIRSNLGAAPVSSLPYTLQIVADLDIGIGTILFQSALVLLQILILQKRFKLKNLLQVPVAVVYGWMTGFSTDLIGRIPYLDHMPYRITMVLIGSFFIALGVAIYVPADIVPLPSEGITKTVSDVTSISFSNMKIIIDCMLVVLSAAVSLCATGTLRSVGIGTAILAVLVGAINKQILKLFQRKPIQSS